MCFECLARIAKRWCWFDAVTSEIYANKRCLQQWAEGLNSGLRRCLCCFSSTLQDASSVLRDDAIESRASRQPFQARPIALRADQRTACFPLPTIPGPPPCTSAALTPAPARQSLHPTPAAACLHPRSRRRAAMIRGVPQLQKLVVRYCPHGGSSRARARSSSRSLPSLPRRTRPSSAGRN